MAILNFDREGCRIDHLDGLSHFLFGFGETEKNPQGGGNYPLGKTRIKLKII